MTQPSESQVGLPTPRATPRVELTPDQPVVVTTPRVKPNPASSVKLSACSTREVQSSSTCETYRCCTCEAQSSSTCETYPCFRCESQSSSWSPRVKTTPTQRVNIPNMWKHMLYAIGKFLRGWQMNVPEDQHDPQAFLANARVQIHYKLVE